jgi:hypothetical protein
LTLVDLEGVLGNKEEEEEGKSGSFHFSPGLSFLIISSGRFPVGVNVCYIINIGEIGNENNS